VDRRFETSRNTANAETEALGVNEDQKSDQLGERPRSLSGSSAVLLGKRASDGASAGFEPSSGAGPHGHHHAGSVGSAYTPTTPEAPGSFAFPPGVTGTRSNPLGANPEPEGKVPYYRPPRPRKGTLPNLGALGARGTVGTFMDNPPGGRNRTSWSSGGDGFRTWSQGSGGPDEPFGPSASGSGTPNVSYFDHQHYQSDPGGMNHRQSATDYTTREVDYYYKRALSNRPARGLGTGPADPTGPVASAAGWFKGLFGGKTRDKGKGFEVVRNSRAPPRMAPQPRTEEQESGGVRRDAGARAGDFSDGEARSDDEDARAGTRRVGKRPWRPDDEDSSSEYSDLEGGGRHSIVPELPPTLPHIDSGDAIELPSRIASKSSSRSRGSRRAPEVPRKSSKRKSAGLFMGAEADRLRTVQHSPSSPEAPHHRLYDPHRPSQHRLHPSTASSSRLPFGSEHSSAGDRRSSVDEESTASSIIPPVDLSRVESGGSGYENRGRYSPPALETLGSVTPSGRGRPTSMGYVQTYRTSDQIHVVESGSPLGLDYRGSAAELVGGSRKSAASSERRPSMI
jgi:hypothetical protein